MNDELLKAAKEYALRVVTEAREHPQYQQHPEFVIGWLTSEIERLYYEKLCAAAKHTRESVPFTNGGKNV